MDCKVTGTARLQTVLKKLSFFFTGYLCLFLIIFYKPVYLVSKVNYITYKNILSVLYFCYTVL